MVSNPKLVTTIAPTVDPISVDDLKLFAKLDIDDDDPILPMFIKAATNVVETYTWSTFISRTYELTLNGFPGTMTTNRHAVALAVNKIPFSFGLSVIELPSPPLQQVYSVDYLSIGDVWTTLDPSQYVVSPGTPGQITSSYGTIFPFTQPNISTLRISYRAGMSDDADGLPPEAKVAVLQMAYHLYTRREIVTEGALTELPIGIRSLLSPLQWGGYR